MLVLPASREPISSLNIFFFLIFNTGNEGSIISMSATSVMDLMDSDLKPKSF